MIPIRTLHRAAVALVAALLLFAYAQSPLQGSWEGAIAPGVLDLGVLVTFEGEGDALSGDIDIPAQGARDLPLTDIAVDGDAVVFVIADVPGDATFDGTLAGDTIAGAFRQGGQEFTFTLTRAAEGAGAPTDPATDPAFLGVWDGVIGPESIDIAAAVTFADDGGAMLGVIDIPAQGLIGFPLEILSLEGDTIVFTLPGIPGAPTITAVRDGDVLAGEAVQSGQTFSVRFERLAAGELPAGTARPQEPQPPFPYTEVEIGYRNGAVTLVGTLTLPEGPGPHPAVVMITGSGPQDRDEWIAGHRPFLVIADHLTRAGFAVLRSDDRGVGDSGGVLSEATYDDLVGDVLAAVAALSERSDIDPERIGLFGHSEGGYLGPLAADRSDDVAFVIMMAGPSVSGREVLLLQNRLIFLLAGGTEEQIEEQVAYIGALADAFEANDFDEAGRLAEARIREQFAALPTDQRPSDAEIDAVVSGQTAGILNTYFRELIVYDPFPVLSRLTVPVLGFYGNLDIQVPAVQNEGKLSGALRVAGNPDYTVVRFDGLNHLMQPARTGAFEEYGVIETTIAPEVLDLVTRWLQERFLR